MFSLHGSTFLVGFSSWPRCCYVCAENHSPDLLSELMVQEGIQERVDSWIEQRQYVDNGNVYKRHLKGGRSP